MKNFVKFDSFDSPSVESSYHEIKLDDRFNIDEFLIDILEFKPKDRAFLLEIEQEVFDFVENK